MPRKGTGGKATQAQAPPRRDVIVTTPDQVRSVLSRRGRDLLGGRLTDPSDPRSSGLTGAYPTLDQRAPWSLPRALYSRVGVLRAIVDKPADDIWAKGWDLVTRTPEAGEAARRWDARARIKAAFRQATRLARRDGFSLIRLRLRDNTGDPEQPPRGVRDILRAEPLSRDVLDHIEFDTDPSSDTFEEPLYYHLRAAGPGEQRGILPAHGFTLTTTLNTIRYHRDRVILVVQHPKEGAPWDGDSVLSWLLGDVQAFENVKWAAAETYFNWARPLLKVTIDESVNYDDSNPNDVAKLDKLDDDIEALQSGVTQKIIQQGFTVEALGDSARINSPDPYARVFMDQLAGGARIPKRELTGSEAGALASASYDEKRYFSSIQNDRDDFATPLLRDEWYARLDRWGLVPRLRDNIESVQWLPNLELSEQEHATVLDVTARAAATFRNNGLPLPKEFDRLLTWPTGFDPSAAPVPAPVNPFASLRPVDPPMEGGGDVAHDLRIEVTPKLWPIEDRLEGGTRRALRAWREEALAAVKATPDAARPRRRWWSPRRDDTVNAAFTFSPDDLADVVRRALMDAAQLGLMRTWRELGRDGVLDFLDRTDARVLQHYAERYAATKAMEATREVRRVIAEALTNGGGPREIEEALLDAFGKLENQATIARTEAMRGYNEGSRSAMREARVPVWEWSAYNLACQFCAPLNGLRFGVNEPMPPEASHPNCRCTVIPIVEEDVA